MEKQRSVRIVVYVEPIIERAMRVAMNKNGDTQSGFLRNALIKELQEHGLLTSRMLEDLVTS